MTCLDGFRLAKRRRLLPVRPSVVLQPILIGVGMTFPTLAIMPDIEHLAQSRPARPDVRTIHTGIPSGPRRIGAPDATAHRM